MTKTLFQDDHTQIIKDRATGYTEGEGGAFKISMSNWDETGDGNVYTTVRDLYLWDQAFYTGALGKDLMDMLQTTGVLNSGKAIDYAWGLVVSEYKGLKVVEHGGAWVGFRAALVRFPEQKFLGHHPGQPRLDRPVRAGASRSPISISRGSSRSRRRTRRRRAPRRLRHKRR